MSSLTLQRGAAAFVQIEAAELVRRFYLGRAKSTVTAYRTDLEAFAAWAGVPGVEEAVAKLLALPKHAADAVALEWSAELEGAPSTRARRLSTLRSLVKTAQRFCVIDWKLDVKDPPVAKFRDTEGPGLDALEKMLRVAECLPGSRQGLRAVVVLLLIATLGLRRDEVAKLRIGGFDGQRRKLYVVGKNQREAFLDVPEMTADAIDKWLRALSHRKPEDFLVQKLDQSGSAVTGQAIYKIIALLARRSGVRTWPHGLRHTAVTEVTRSEGLVTASKFARHKDVKTTMIYQDNIANLAGIGAETMARLLKERYSHETSRLCWAALRDALRAKDVDVAWACSFCWYCGRKESNLVIEHMVPRSRGGSDDAENLAVACRSCNTMKSSRTVKEYRKGCARSHNVALEKVIFAGEHAGLMTEPPDPPPEEPPENPFDPENNATAGIGL